MEATTLWRIRGAVLAGIFGSLLLFLGLGYGVDRLLDTSPKGLLVGLLLSFPVSNILGIKLAKRFVLPTSSTS